MLPSYYGIRGRSFISDSDFCPSTKQFSPDVYSSTLGGKPLGCEPSTMSSYSSLIDSYYPETFGDYRSAATFSSSGGSFLPSSALSSLLPPFGGESSHLFLVWIRVTVARWQNKAHVQNHHRGFKNGNTEVQRTFLVTVKHKHILCVMFTFFKCHPADRQLQMFLQGSACTQLWS